ncbi:hypothetical protein BHE74_00022928 [Ensete ventricosum]|nr:hypothetical protein BHE74_00022928 [Ensete ventricosum]
MWGRINVGKKDLWVPPFTFYFLPGKTPPPPAHGRHIRPVELRHLSRVDWLLSLLSPTTTRASLLVILFPPPRTVGYPSSAFPNRESHLGSRARAAGAGGGPQGRPTDRPPRYRMPVSSAIGGSAGSTIRTSAWNFEKAGSLVAWA